MPTLRQLEYLVALADTGHVGRAAERAGVSQPTLSMQIAELEKRLGVTLAERGRGGALLTAAGRDAALRAREILRSVEELKESAAGARTGMGGRLRLGVLPTIGPYLLPHILPALHRRYPDLRLYVREDFPGPLETGLLDGRFDLLITSLPVDLGGIETEPVFREELMLALPSDHPAARKAKVPRDALGGENILALELGHRYHQQVRALSEELGAQILPDFEGTSLDTLRQMAAMGTGVTFLPALYVHADSGRRGDVAMKSLDPAPPTRTVGLAWRRNSPARDDFLAVGELIRSRIRSIRITGAVPVGSR